MKKDLNNKEQRLKSILEDFSGSVDTQAVWSSIEHRVDTKEKESKSLWVFMLGAIAIAFLCGLAVSHYIYSDVIKDLEYDSAPIAEENNNEEDGNKGVRPTLNKQSIQETENDLLQNENLEVKQATSEHFASQKLNSKISKPPISITQNALQQNPFSNIDVFNSDLLSSNINVSENKNNTQSPTFSGRSQSEILMPTDGIDTQRSAILRCSEIQKSIALIEFEERHFDKEAQLNIPLNKAKVSNAFLSLSSGVQNNSFERSILDQDLDDVLLSQFLKETAMPSWAASISYGKEINNDWTISGGLFASNIVTRYQNQDQDVSANDREGVQLIEIDTEGAENITTGLVSVERVVDYDLTWHQNKLDLDAQIGVGKSLFKIGKFQTSLQGHIAYNVFNNISGYAYNDEGLFSKDQMSIENQITNKSKLKFMIDLPIQYHLDRLSIDLRPYYRFQTKGDVVGASLYSIKNSQLGITLGVTYRPCWK